jgi:GxxExxY protein
MTLVAQNSGMKHHELTDRILDAYYEVHRHLKHGYPEVFYQRALSIALKRRDIAHQREVPTQVTFLGHSIGTLKMDLVVDHKVIVECKRAPRLTAEHRNQVLGYLNATEHEVGLLLNFGPVPEHKRVVLTR